ncbi:MAG: DNA cytosine methyltransferase [Kiritimatiellae bacterium]|nr:DNA cytosine methyltransferase [Kiritimatiellia bacterium]
MKVVSLFSGAGGLDLGFIAAGNEIVWANDLYGDAVETYRANIGDHIVCCDIAEVPSAEIPDCDIVIGGFPCQGFSVANMKRHESDSRNKLYLQLLRVIRDKKPRFFLAENVKGILHFLGGRAYEQILEDMRALGYRVKSRLFNVADYGVPQKRERVVFVGVRNDIDFDYEFPAPTHDKDGANGLSRWVGVGAAFAGIPDPDKPNNVPNHVYSKYKLNFNGYIGHRPLDPEKPAPTVTARGDDKGGVVILPHPSNRRRMTGRELATVQSFPFDFEFKGPLSSVYRQIGNAVPPKFAEAVARQFNAYQGGVMK